MRKRWTMPHPMELWEDGTGMFFLIFKIFSFQDNLKSKLRHAVLLYCHVTKNRGKNSLFPDYHWVASSMIDAFHPTTLFLVGEFERFLTL